MNGLKIAWKRTNSSPKAHKPYNHVTDLKVTLEPLTELVQECSRANCNCCVISFMAEHLDTLVKVENVITNGKRLSVLSASVLTSR